MSLRPEVWTRRYSARLRIRSEGGSEKSGELFLGNGHGQACPPLPAPTSEGLLPTASLHPLAEAVGAQAALIVGLVGPLHGRLLTGAI